MADWIDKTGKEWKFSEMSDGHLLNTERFLRRQAGAAMHEAGIAGSMPFQGEMAQDAALQAMDGLMDASFVMQDKAKKVRAVIKERGLTPKDF